MKKLMILLAMVIGLLMSGCATQTVWTHPDYTPEKWAKDRYECEKDARQSGYFGTGIVGSINMQNFFNGCLESKGWTKTTAKREDIEKASTYGTTGISVDPRDKSKEAIIIRVIPNSPADKAGIQAGDKIVERNGQPISCIGDIEAMGRLRAGERVTYKVDRNGKIQVFELVAVPVVRRN